MSVKRRKSGVAAATAVLLAAGLGLAPAYGEPAAPTTQGVSADEVDYYADVYGLRADSVFETVTYERFNFILGQEGTFAFLLGGPADDTTKNTVGIIDEVAQELGVETIYNFDPRLDGQTLDIRTTQNEDFAPLWTNLVSTYLGVDEEFDFNSEDSAPTLFVYNRSISDSGETEESVVSIDILDAVTSGAQGVLVPGSEPEIAYRAEVSDVLGSVDAFDEVSNWDFYLTEVNRKHLATYKNPELYGAEILGEEDSDWRIQQISYPELINILDSEGDYIIFFGGAWCHNTRAVFKEINAQAVANDVPVVYNFDLRLDGNGGGAHHIRDHYTETRPSHLYGDLVTNYLPNLTTQYSLDGVNPGHQVKYYPGGVVEGDPVKAQKLQVPFLFQYNKDNVVDGTPAPYKKGWIRDNGDGTYREYMSEWWYVNHLPGRLTDETAIADAYAFADEAVAKLGAFFTEPLPVTPEPEVTPEEPVKPVKPGKDEHKYTQVVPSADLNGDGKADSVAVDAKGKLWLLAGDGNGGFAEPDLVGSGWTGLEISAPGDWNGDGKADLLATDAQGKLWLYAGNGKGGFAARVQAGHGWVGYEIFPTGDLNGDGKADLLATDEDGILWLYAGKEDGKFKAAKRVGQGWHGFALYPAGDLDGDGLGDILSIDSKGRLFSHLGKGEGQFRKSVQSGQGWHGYELFSGTDFNGDGIADLLSRDSKGQVRFYAGKGAAAFRTAVKVGTGW